ncbi:hypothetical protein GCM10010912_41760 [Paenibacillus albidus]|uniref:DUF4349 domain-containing protein n=1 Tax=Paenibacillus albidus TaxID=2041023 RepID=A0A917FMB2_9BACL|nr:DUF4349 domain-containing protein [Paenibacillus albidus]GGF92413.1 hypothetical protein GCM10010912_41760 [Paenibacillus albidus]
MRKWGLHYLGLLILAVALILAGCSSSDQNSSANTAASSEGSGSALKEDLRSESAVANMADQTSDEASTAAAPAEAPAAGGDPAIQDTTAANTASGSSGFTGSDVVAGLNKKLIYHANLDMQVQDYAKAQTKVRSMVTLANGYIIEFTENVSEYEQGGTFTLKVPASGFSSFLSNLEKVEHVALQRSIQGQDVSEEYVDLESRLKAKQLMEIQYTEFMKKATKSADLVAFANELGSIQEQIEQIKGRMRYIDQNVSFSTVELRLYQTDDTLSVKQKEEQGPLMERASEALQGTLKALSVAFQSLFVFLAAALPVLIVGGLVLAVVLWYRKRATQRKEEQSNLRRLANQKQLREQPAAKEADEEKE